MVVVDEHRDHVAEILDAWHAELPELDVSPVSVFGRITRIDRYQAAAMRGVYRLHGLDAGEYDVLAALRRSGPSHRLTPTELYRSVLVTSATMTERLDRLERRDLIRRLPAARDRRSVLVELTSEGTDLFDRTCADLLSAEAALLDGLPAADRSALAALLSKLAALLERQDEAAASSA